MKEVYIVLDHTRTVLITITDGSLPSNVGGGGNVRNILRRCFHILKKNGWWDKLQMEGFLQIFEHHKLDLQGIYGKFNEYRSFDEIIKVEYERWLTTDDAQAKNLEGLIKKRKGDLTIDDWIVAMQSWGMSADKISEVCKQPIPGNLYYEISVRQEKVAKAPEKILYSTINLPETTNLYYQDGKQMSFDAKVISVYTNVHDKNKKNERNLIILD
jgi:alanyl-tRNA synthetase